MLTKTTSNSSGDQGEEEVLYFCIWKLVMLPSVLDPRSCIGSLSALGPVHDLIANDVVEQSISGSATEGISW